MTFAEFIDHLPTIGSAAVGAYHVISRAGGLRGIWRELLGQKEPPASK